MDKQTTDKFIIVVFFTIYTILILFVGYNVHAIKNGALYYNTATTPDCVVNVNTLPIFRTTVYMMNGSVVRGTVFLINPSQFVTAAHVVTGGIFLIEIHLNDNTTIRASLDSIDNEQDVAVLNAENPLYNYEPLKLEKKYRLLKNVWNIGFPGWADTQQVITSGKIMGTNANTVHTSAMVMEGMSGGPTIACYGNDVTVIGVISKYNRKLISSSVISGDDGEEWIEHMFINTGEGVSAKIL